MALEAEPARASVAEEGAWRATGFLAIVLSLAFCVAAVVPRTGWPSPGFLRQARNSPEPRTAWPPPRFLRKAGSRPYPTRHDGEVTLHQLDTQRYGGALCMDGSPGAFYFRRAPRNQTSDKWLIMLEGGGWCFSPADCAVRAKNGFGSSRASPVRSTGDATTLGGFASFDCSVSPEFCEYNHVSLVYCDGTSFSGDLRMPFMYYEDRVNWTDGRWYRTQQAIHFRGKQILHSVIDTLLEDFSMSQAGDVLFAGCSAGALGVVLNADAVRAQIEAKAPGLRKFGAVPCSGFFLDHANLEGNRVFASGFATSVKMANWTLPDSTCAGDLGPMHSWKCRLPEIALRYVRTPTFVINSALDQWQTGSILCGGYLYGSGPSAAELPGWDSCAHDVTTCSAKELPQMNAYIDSFEAAIRAASSLNMTGNGAFIHACHWHCEATSNAPYNHFQVGGVTMRQALVDWWSSGFSDSAAAHSHFERGRYETPGALANPSCTKHEDNIR